MGQIRKRGAFYQVRYYRSGQRIEESTGFKKYEEARDLLREREGEIAKGVPITAKSTRLTFDDAAADVIDDYKVNGKRSLVDLERRITLHLKPVFGGRTLNSITTADARAFAARRVEAGASNAEVNRELATLKRAFRLAVASSRYHGRVPAIQMLKESAPRTGFFDDEMIDAVITQLPAPLKPVIRFAYITGWRVSSEILPLEWRRTDLKSGEVRLDAGTTKNGQARVIHVSGNADLMALLKAAWTEHEALKDQGTICPWVFQRDGKRIKYMDEAWDGACRRAGYPGRLMHDLRRSAARNLVRSGVPESVAMAITGHKTRSVFERYNITSPTDIRNGLGAVGTNRGDNPAKASTAPA